MSKDNFSKQADLYAKYRPQYPVDLYNIIFSRCLNYDKAWDVATGNGQAAVVLADKFKLVEASDISSKQIEHAVPKSNIHYSIQNANTSLFENQSFDLITVAQALHWFDLNKFFKEVNRTIKKGGVFAAWCYGLNSVNKEIDQLTFHLYQDIVGSYWDKERRHIEQQYKSIPFPWEMESAQFNYTLDLSADEYIGYLSTWSSVLHYINQNKSNPLALVENQIREKWGNKPRQVNFPIHLKLVCL